MNDLLFQTKMRFQDKYLLLDSAEFYLHKKVKSRYKFDFAMLDKKYRWWVVFFKETLSHVDVLQIGKEIGEASKRFKIPDNIKYS